MQVIVPSIYEKCPAMLTLCAEGLNPFSVLLSDDYDYGTLLKRLWLQQEGFIIVEHDVVPWPGAIKDLLECTEPYCAFQYPLGSDGMLSSALGCTKFGQSVLAEYLHAADTLDCTPWTSLDSVLLSQLSKPHIHAPAVAHARDQREADSECLHTACWVKAAPLLPSRVTCDQKVRATERPKKKRRLTEPPLKFHPDFVGFRIWYADGTVLSSKDGAWNQLPSDGVQFVTFYHKETYQIFDDGWRTENYVVQFYGHGNNYFWLDSAGQPSSGNNVSDKLPSGSIKVGSWILDLQYQDLVALAQSVRTAP